MEDVILLQVEGDRIQLSQFFEAPTALHASVKEVDFLKHTVTLIPTEGETEGER